MQTQRPSAIPIKKKERKNVVLWPVVGEVLERNKFLADGIKKLRRTFRWSVLGSGISRTILCRKSLEQTEYTEMGIYSVNLVLAIDNVTR